MASEIKRGESLFIPFRNGKSIYDSQCKPRMYKTVQAFEKSFPGHYQGTDGVELVEYAPVVRCKDCKHHGGVTFGNRCKYWSNLVEGWVHFTNPDDFCSYGERKDNEDT